MGGRWGVVGWWTKATFKHSGISCVPAIKCTRHVNTVDNKYRQ